MTQAETIRALLLQHPKGLTVRQIARHVKSARSVVGKTIKAMPDIRIVGPVFDGDRYVRSLTVVPGYTPPPRPNTTAERIRKALRAAPDGLSIDGILAATGLRDRNTVSTALRRMDDTYIDRWVEQDEFSRRHLAIWCLSPEGEVYEDCPKPEKGGRYA